MPITISQSQLKTLKETLKKAELTPQKKQRLMWRIAKLGAIPAIKRYVKNQTNVDGKAFDKRTNKKRRALVRDMPKLIKIRELPEHSSVKLYFSGKYKSSSTSEISAGVIAAVQNQGLTIKQRKSQYKNKIQKDEPVTKAQIKRLRDLGYINPKTKKKATRKYIEQTFTRAKAGLVIKKMLDEEIKDVWNIEMPSRSFFGISDNDFNNAIARQLKGINFGFNVKAQDIKKRGNK